MIGESEGLEHVYERIPGAAREWGAIYLSFGRDPATGQEVPFTSAPGPWPASVASSMWAMNSGWLIGLMGKQTLFYDIELHADRPNRGVYYPCERRVLQGYPNREERYWPNTIPFTGGNCPWIP